MISLSILTEIENIEMDEILFEDTNISLHKVESISVYSKVTYSVDSIKLEYLCNRWSDSHGGFGIEFGMKFRTDHFPK